MKLIVGCDGRDTAAYFTALARTIALHDADVLLVHVVDTAFEESWRDMAGHHWLGRRPGGREESRFQAASALSAPAILQEAASLGSGWPVSLLRPIELHGNPERELVRLALQERADLIAVGQHRVELGPHAIGRCARFVLDHAPCPVLLVRDEAIRDVATDLLGNRLGTPRT
jgi:nucleotide-binding universal stress UspA family protein